MGVFSWLAANWQGLVVAILAVDAALIPLLPNVPFLKQVYDALSKVAPKS